MTSILSGTKRLKEFERKSGIIHLQQLDVISEDSDVGSLVNRLDTANDGTDLHSVA
jgi:hypothetical protein